MSIGLPQPVRKQALRLQMRHAFPALIVFVSMVFTSVSASAGIKAGKAGDMKGRSQMSTRNVQPRLIAIKPAGSLFQLKGNLRGGRSRAPASMALNESNRRVARLPAVSQPARLHVDSSSAVSRATHQVALPATTESLTTNGVKLQSRR